MLLLARLASAGALLYVAYQGTREELSVLTNALESFLLFAGA